MELLRNVLKRGVNVYIGYWHDYQTTSKLGLNFENALSELLKLKEEGVKMNFQGKLLLSEYSDYEKILIEDQAYVIYGGNSWLSEIHNKYEHSYMITDKELASKELKRVISLLETNYEKASKKAKKIKKNKLKN